MYMRIAIWNQTFVDAASRNRLSTIGRQRNYVDRMSTAGRQHQRDRDRERHQQARGQ